MLVLLFSFPVYAQGKIGGGGYLDPGNYDYVFTDDESEGSIPQQSLKEAQFVFALSSREKECRPNGKHYFQEHGRSFLKTYFDLLELKNKFKPNRTFPDVDSYFQCLFSPYVKKTLKELLEDKEMAFYLSKKYQIPLVRISLILVYFQSLYHGCFADECVR